MLAIYNSLKCAGFCGLLYSKGFTITRSFIKMFLSTKARTWCIAEYTSINIVFQHYLPLIVHYLTSLILFSLFIMVIILLLNHLRNLSTKHFFWYKKNTMINGKSQHKFRSKKRAGMPLQVACKNSTFIDFAIHRFQILIIIGKKLLAPLEDRFNYLQFHYSHAFMQAGAVLE